MALGVGDIVRTSVNFLLGSGDQYQNVYQHIFDGIGGISDQAVVDDIELWVENMYNELIAQADTNILEQLCYVDQIEWVDTEWVTVANIGTFTPAWNPASVAVQLPNQSSPFVVFKTARPRTVGKKFLFPTPTAGQDSGILTAGVIEDIVAYADDAVNDIVLDVANELHPGVTRVAINDWETFTVAFVTNLIGSQRRRRQGYGA